jgi:aspartokinase/homoserine dehydrogenase 1
MRTEVHKFGGTSVGSAERLRAAASLIDAAAHHTRLVVVASAMAGITDRLVAAARSARLGQIQQASESLDQMEAQHDAVLRELDPDAVQVRADLAALAEELRALLRSAHVLGELSPRVHDRIVATGEKWSTRLLTVALHVLGRRAQVLDADTFLETDGEFGEASPQPGAERTITGRLLPLLDQGIVAVVTGYCGRAPDGATTTLGRGGSDLSATVLARALRADEVVIWTDVPGVFTADPRIVPEARTIAQLNYREAAELAYYGAKVLHQRTMIPVASLGIPVRTRSSFEPAHPGTLVDRGFTPGSHPVKGISAIRGQCLLSLEGNGLAGVPGVSARLFGALASRRISVTMISQSSSEASICFALPSADADEAERVLKAEFRPELSRGYVEEIVVQRGVGLVACVGLGMAHTPGVAARIFGALGKRRVNVLAIAQGSSELNISLALREQDVPEAIRALHSELGLHRLDPGVEAHGGLDLILLGCGKVGRALVQLVKERADRVEARFGVRPRFVGLADRSGYRFDPMGLDLGELEAMLAGKAEGRSLASWPGARSSPDLTELVREASRWRLVRPVLVDVTDADHEAFPLALSAGFDVVTANKVPLAGPMASWRQLVQLAQERGRILKAEATVGAGLPVIDTVEMLLATGDQLLSVEGCFSGTLGFVMTRLRQGVRFSEAVREAAERGYTEPDPVVDLSGADVARKASILGRLSGLLAEETPVSLEGLCDPAWAGLPREELLQRLATLDEPMARRVEQAQARQEVLQFVARVEVGEGRGRVQVGPVAVPADSPMGALRGTDNLVVFTTERYRERPLVVQGPGAGISVTAMGVLSDVLRIAAERR